MDEQRMEYAGNSTAAMFEVGDILDVGVFAVDSELKILQWNNWMQSASGLIDTDVIGRPLLEFFPAIAGTNKESALRRALSGENVLLAHRFHEFLIPLPCAPGITAFDRMQQTARIVPASADGATPCAIAFIMDVSERAAREKELRIARDAAESASRAKSDFLAAMSHELRTPLSAVIGYAELIKHQIAGPITEQQRMHAERITSSAWHLIGIIDEVLTFSRAEAGREEVHIEEVDMCEAARTAMTRVEPQAQQKGLTLSLECEDDAMTFYSDPLRIQQIVINLLGNAVKFTEKGGVTVTVTRERDEMTVKVRDTGPGIPPSHRDQIFEAFTQVDQTATRAKGGTGLGLPVSRKLAELLGGSLTLEPHTGSGSTFVLCLPSARHTPSEVEASV